MHKFLVILFAVSITACAKTNYYIVRHAEKATAAANMSSDVPLSSEGAARAQALSDKLMNAGITAIYSTNTIRTKTTAGPISERLGLTVNSYAPGDTLFVPKLKEHAKGNVLIVGHSNTVDDLVNQFTGTKTLTDLPESAFGDMFIITRKGKKYSYSRDRFGK